MSLCRVCIQVVWKILFHGICSTMIVHLCKQQSLCFFTQLCRLIGWGIILPQKRMWSNYYFGICLKETTVQRFNIITLSFANNSHGSFLPHHGWSWDIFLLQLYKCFSYKMSHEANHIYFLCLIPVRIVFCMATCCCNGHFNETFFVYGVSILVIDPINSAFLGMINVKILHGKSITLYLWSHQIPDVLGHSAYTSMPYSHFL